MTITSSGDKGNGNSVVSGTTLTVTFTTTTSANEEIILVVAADNQNVADGDAEEITSVVDSKGNIFRKEVAWAASQSGAGNGSYLALWRTKVVNTHVSSDTVTVTFANAITAKVGALRGYTVSAGNTLSRIGWVAANDLNSSTVTSLTLSGLPSQNYAFFRVCALESNTAGNFNQSASWDSAITSYMADSGSFGTSMKLGGERLITSVAVTANPASNPTTNSGTCDATSILIGWYEAVNAFSPPPRNPYARYQPFLVR